MATFESHKVGQEARWKLFKVNQPNISLSVPAGGFLPIPYALPKHLTSVEKVWVRKLIIRGRGQFLTSDLLTQC